MVENWSDFAPLRRSGNVWRFYWLSQLGRGAAGISWVEAKDAAKHGTTERPDPTTGNDPAPNVRSAEVKKPCFHGT